MEVPFAPGGCVAVSRETFNDVGGFERGFSVYGYEDAEFSLKLWLFGYRVEVDPSVIIKHHFRTRHPYPITMSDYTYNAVRMAVSHFNSARVGRVIGLFKGISNIGHLIAKVFLDSDALLQREKYFAKRKFDDNWFLNKFNIKL
ncbi:hypothetical protein N752_21000 [Desulforamulus aquiferis]|nr:galactosyltransferase-related protein [Desulforamulus aquiferis]RYD03312.1 hypothetical protein N752_21000 [Desulforamulus aquiferis]